MRLLTIGTCRIYGAATFMPNARRFQHRVHNPAEIERAIDLLLGTDHPADLSHILSEYALSTVKAHPDDFRQQLNAPLDELRALPFDAYAIEISSLRTYWGASEQGPVLVDTVVTRSSFQEDQQLEALYRSGHLRRVQDIHVTLSTPAETRAAMKRIKGRLDRPIIWLSHGNLPNPRSGEEHLVRVRGSLIEKVSQMATALGDAFVDPTTLVEKHGREAIFAMNGEDLYHYTDFAHAELAAALESQLLR